MLKLKNILETILSFLNSIPKDKYQHAVIGVVIYVVFTMLFCILGTGHILANIYSVTLTLLVALTKEAYDDLDHNIHTPDIKDIIATIFLPLILAIFIYLH